MPQPALLTLGRVRGVPVQVSPSWLIVGALLTLLYGPLLQDLVDGLGRGAAYLAALGFSVLFALCILAHELGHTVVSTRLGYPVRRVVLFLLGGVSEIEGDARRPSHEAMIAGSGPLVSLLIAAAAFGGHAAVEPASVAGVLLALLAWSNLVLAVFNLLPGLPLDGGRLLRAVVWACGASKATSTKAAAWTGRALAVVVVAAGVLLNLGFASALLTVVLGLYLWANATQSLRLADLLARLPRVQVPALLRPGLMVEADTSAGEALRRIHSTDARGLVVIDAEHRPTAIVDERRIGALPPHRLPWTPVSEVSRPLADGGTVPVGIDADGLLEHMQQHPAGEYLAVDDHGRPAGIIVAAEFANELRTAGGDR
ncbi:hypothetical protein GCM10027265_13720 [Jatrophihabitans fulvus]